MASLLATTFSRSEKPTAQYQKYQQGKIMNGITLLPTQRTFTEFLFVITLTLGLLQFPSAQAQNLYLVNGANGRTYQFTTSGVGSAFPFSNGSGSGFPIPVVIDSAGNLFEIIDVVGGDMIKTTPAGVKSTFATGIGFALDAQIDIFGNIFVASNGIITKITPSGVKSVFSTLGVANLTSDNAGNVFAIGNQYTASNSTDLIKFTPNGVQSTFATGLSEVDGFSGLATDSMGDIFALNSHLSSIIKITPNGLESTFATGIPFGIEDGLAIDRSDNLFVANINGNILKFTPSGVESTFETGFLHGDFQPESLTFGPPAIAPEPSTVFFGVGLCIAGIASLSKKTTMKTI